jgi:hypothetical protein
VKKISNVLLAFDLETARTRHTGQCVNTKLKNLCISLSSQDSKEILSLKSMMYAATTLNLSSGTNTKLCFTTDLKPKEPMRIFETLKRLWGPNIASTSTKYDIASMPVE